MRLSLLFLVIAALPALLAAEDEFAVEIKPVLEENCSACHNPDNPKNKVDFLKAATTADVAARRGLWKNVSTQLRNRTMPPVDSKLTETARFRVTTWIDEKLRETACQVGEHAGSVVVRRLTRRDYRNTIRDLLGVDFEVSEIFPADGSGGEGFDTTGETLFVPPLLMERYIEAAQQVLDRTIVTPALNKTYRADEIAKDFPVADREGARWMQTGDEVSLMTSVYVEDEYNLRVTIERPAATEANITVSVDGIEADKLVYAKDPNGGATGRVAKVHLARGVHSVTAHVDSIPVEFFSVQVTQKADEPTFEKRYLHHRLFRLEPGEAPLRPREMGKDLLTRFLAQAFRRPVDDAEVDRFMTLYDRAAERNDPFEERVKLALKAALVSPEFLFRMEQTPDQPGLRLVSDYELATRLSYFLWSTMPDAELRRLAAAGKLHEPDVLLAQVDRLIDDPRSRVFAKTFVGQWLGTKDVGGRIAPTVNAVQHYYTPEVAADMREEPVLLFHHILSEDRSLLDLIDSNYTYLNERLVRFYQVEDQVQGVEGDDFQRVDWTDARRGGVLGLGAVLAMTSHFQQNSPVLRGAWVLDTLLGTPTPPPPPNVPPLETGDNNEDGLTMRQKLQRHRADPSCSACHDIIDPIGFALENFDWLGRWRDAENGKPVDAKGEMPSGESFDGPAALREVLLTKKDEFLRHLTGKVLGYAVGRSLEDADQCTIQRIVDKLEADGYRARTLVREVVLSTPFRYVEGAPAQVAAAQ